MRSLTYKTHQIEVILHEAKPSVFILSEHWLTNNYIDNIHIEGYKLCSAYCRAESYGGVAIFVANHLYDRTSKREDIKSLAVSNEFECCGIELKLSDVSYVITGVYIPPNANLEGICNKFTVLCDKVIAQNKELIIGGDINTDLLSPNPRNQMLIDTLSTYDLSPIFNEPTRVDGNSKTCIDNIFVSYAILNSLNVKKIIKCDISDHYGQLVSFNVKNNFEKQTSFKRCLNDTNMNKFCEVLNYVNWNNVLNETCPNKALNTFYNTFSQVYDSSFPEIAIKKCKNNNNNNLTTELIYLKNKVSVLSNLAKVNNEYKGQFKAANKLYQQKLIENKRTQNDLFVQRSLNKGKSIWHVINNIKGKLKTQKLPHLKNDQGEDLTTTETCNKLNNFFVNTASNLDIDPINFNEATSNIESCTKNIFLAPILPEEISSAIHRLKNSTATAHDNTSNFLMKSCIHKIIEPIHHICNLSITKGIFPEKLKKATVTVLFKKGDPDNLGNYRPISILSCIAKLLEHLMNDRIIKFLNNVNFFPDSQHGFLAGRSTDTALAQFTERILTALDKKLIAMGLFIDLSKAFDCVNHELLIEKMRLAGIRGLAEDWFRSYLSNRSQTVKANSIFGRVESVERTVNNGVPQGSVLAPTLFLIFVKDLERFIMSRMQGIYQTSYADDTNYLVTGSDLSTVQSKITALYKLVCMWAKLNGLCINKEKTKFIVFRTKNSKVPNNIKLTLDQNIEIVESSNVKLLGVYLDSQMSWSKHVDNLSNKLSTLCYAMRILKQHCSNDILIHAYYGNFYPHLLYGILFWGSCAQSYTNRIFVLQKKVLRIMFNLNTLTSCKRTFIDKKFLTLYGIYIYAVLCYFFKHRKYYLKINDNSFYITRNANLMYYPIHNLTIYERGLFYSSLKLFNSLPTSLKQINNFNTFKNNLKELLINCAPYDILEYHNFCKSVK